MEDIDNEQGRAEAGVPGIHWLVRLAILVGSGFNKWLVSANQMEVD